MKIWNDLCKSLNLEGEIFCGNSFALYNKNTLVVEGAKKVLAVSQKQVCFLFGNGQLVIEGQNLVLKSLSKGFAVICGDITKIDF